MKTNIAEAIVKTLIAEKVDTVFGLPGSQLIPIYGALINNSSKIRHILLRHEQAVGFAGMGYALTTNRTGVLMVMPGPGITNITSSVAEAFYQSVPLLIITADHPRQNLGKEAFHELDSFTMLKPITKLILNPKKPDEVIHSLQEGLIYSRLGKPGPVYINIPANFLKEESLNKSSMFQVPGYKPKLKKEEIKKVANLIEKSKSPIILAGSGVLRSDSTKELQALAEELKIPVMTTLGGKGAIAENHPLAIGTPSFDLSFEFLKETDLALVIGARLNPVNTKMETLPLPQTIVRVDISPEKKSKYRPFLNLKYDCKVFLTELLKEVKNRKTPPKKNKIMEIFNSARSDYRDYFSRYSESRLITPPELFKQLSGILRNEDFIFLTDSVWIPSTYLLPQILKPYSFACIRSFGCLGFALPAAIGAAIANPNKKIVSLSGDGAFLFNCQEIASSVDYNLKNLYQIIMINDGYGSIKGLEQNLLNGKSTAVDWKPVDFEKIAEGFGAKGFFIKEKTDLKETLTSALKENGPSIISVQVENIPTMRKDVMKALLKKTI